MKQRVSLQALLVDAKTAGEKNRVKEKTPHCPHCQNASFVVLDKKGVQTGTVIGGIVGAGATCAGTVGKPSGPPIATLMVLLMSLLTGFLAGAKIGNAIGEQIDGSIIIRYRCNNCGAKFSG